MLGLINRFKCLVGKHNYKVKREVAPGIRELKCKHCLKEFAVNEELQSILPLDQELKEAHDIYLKF